MDAAAWGVQHGYHDAMGRWRDSPPETIDAILRTMGASGRPFRGPPAVEPVLFLRPGEAKAVSGPSILHTEDGAEVRVDDHLPADLPLGYHALTRLDDGAVTTVVVSPGRCPLPAGDPTWGWAVQLYAMRSAASWGMGDLADLRHLASWSAAELGAGLVLVNPLHAAAPGFPQSASPYFPSSRRFRNPLYLRVEDVPGARAALGDRLDELAAAGRALNGERLIDRDAVWRLKLDALGQVWDAFPGDPAFDRWREAEGDALDAYATFCALVEEHGGDWQAWPEALRHPDRPEVAAYGRAHADRVRFHQWLQWLVDLQLESASTAGVAVMHDLAVGVDPGGADAWLWQDVFALDMAVGAPPDEFNTRGQDWGLPPFDPWRLRAAGYGPFVETIRASLRHAGGLRLDHVMGLFRLFWIPRGQRPPAGAYVRYPASGAARHRRPRGPPGRRLRGGRGPGDGRGPRPGGDGRPRPALLPAAVVRGPAAAGVPGAGAGRRHHPRPAHRRRPVDGLRPRATSTGWAWSPTWSPPSSMCRRLGDMAGVAADAPPDEAVAAMYAALAPPPACCSPPPSTTPWPCPSVPTCPVPSTNGPTGRSPCPCRWRS